MSPRLPNRLPNPPSIPPPSLHRTLSRSRQRRSGPCSPIDSEVPSQRKTTFYDLSASNPHKDTSQTVSPEDRIKVVCSPPRSRLRERRSPLGRRSGYSHASQYRVDRSRRDESSSSGASLDGIDVPNKLTGGGRCAPEPQKTARAEPVGDDLWEAFGNLALAGE